MAGFVEGCATTFSCCLKLESEDVKHARTLDRAAEEDRKARLEAQRKLQQKTHNAALLGRATSLQEPRPPTPVKLATPSSDEAPSASEPTVSRTPSHKSTTSRTSRRSMFGNLFRNSRRALSFHTPRQPKRNELAAVVQEDADVALTVPGPSKALAMGNVKAVYRVDTPLGRTHAGPPPKHGPLFAALLPCCYVPPTPTTVTGRGEAQGVHMQGVHMQGVHKAGEDGVEQHEMPVHSRGGRLVEKPVHSVVDEGVDDDDDDAGVLSASVAASGLLVEHTSNATARDAAAGNEAYQDVMVQTSQAAQQQPQLIQQGTITATTAVVLPAQATTRVVQRLRVRTITRIAWNAQQATISQRIDNTSAGRSPRMVLRMRRK